ncbi:effector-associated domain 2-containing protein [Actinomadura miaoliensis]|uniref:Effector-associated domain-containing protein n=1 Tax=Actinomadura miaoliensis TaxID=430685 RepID=A0ABP7VB45_9ACTN
MRDGVDEVGEARKEWIPSGHCTIFACDIVGFGKRPDGVQRRLREVMYEALSRCFGASGLPYDDCYREDRGDGAIIILPPASDPARLVHPLPDHLRAELRRHNEVSVEQAQMRLRVALHAGPLTMDDNGMVGVTVNHAARLLDAPSFKAAFTESAADLGILASDEFYREVIKEGLGAIDPTEFRRIEIRLKETYADGWLCIREPVGERSSESGSPLAPTARDTEPSKTVPGPRAAPAEPELDRPALPPIFEIVDRLLEIPLLASPDGREQIVGSLRQEIAIRIARRPQPNLDVHSIVRTCLEFPNGLEEFLAVVRSLVGDTAQMRRLEQTVAALVRSSD